MLLNFTTWLNESDDFSTNVFGADRDEVHSWLTQKFMPGNQPQIIFRGDKYQVIGQPEIPQARGKFVQARLVNTKKDKLIPIEPLIRVAT
jgi:hypothetical protein